MKINSKVRNLSLILIAAIGLSTYSQFSRPIHSSSNVVTEHQKKNNRMRYVNYNVNNQIGKKNLIKDNSFSLDSAHAAASMDANNGEIVYSQNGNKKQKIASVAKIMTLYLVERKVQQTPNGWNQIVNTSNSGLRKMSRNPSMGGFKFKKGHKYTVKQLYKAALIASSNNAAIALGEWVGGSNANFINMMNKQAKIWHLNAHFVSASGLENHDLKPYGYWIKGGYHSANEVSANSVLVMARYLIHDYPQIINDSKKTTEKVDGQTLYNVNGLLKGKTFYSSSLKVDGLKTGYTPDAGYCFVGTGQKKHKDRILTVTLNDDNEFSDTASLMKYVYKKSTLFN